MEHGRLWIEGGCLGGVLRLDFDFLCVSVVNTGIEQ